MKTALITGAAGGMGKAVSLRLAAEGWKVYGLDRRIPEPQASVAFLETDLTDPESVQAAFDRLSAEGVCLDAILHMAGVYELDSLVEIDEEAWSRVFQVNLFGPYRVNRTFLPLLKPGGTILLTTSELAPLDPLPFTGIYAVTKTALEAYAASLRMELQLLGYHVLVLRPGAVDTGLLDVSTDRLTEFCEHTTHYACNARRFRQIVQRVEARKIPPERIAALVSKLLRSRRKPLVRNINRNPLLLLMNALPDRVQCRIIRGILRTPATEKEDDHDKTDL